MDATTLANNLTSLLRKELGLQLAVEKSYLSGLELVVMIECNLLTNQWKRTRGGSKIEKSCEMWVNCLKYPLIKISSPGDLLLGRVLIAYIISLFVMGWDSL